MLLFTVEEQDYYVGNSSNLWLMFTMFWCRYSDSYLTSFFDGFILFLTEKWQKTMTKTVVMAGTFQRAGLVETGASNAVMKITSELQVQISVGYFSNGESR